MFKIILISIRLIISIILAVISYRYAFVYNLHMFQLNGYKNGEHMRWIRKHIRRQWILVAAVVIGVMTILLPGGITDGICLLWFLLCIAVYQALCGMSQKKPLVYTARVKRLTATVIILDAALLVLAAILWDAGEGLFIAAADGVKPFFRLLFLKVFYGGYGTLAVFDGLLLILTGLKLVSCVIGCLVNSPVEKGINLHFINDAKRILAKNPNLTIIGVTGSYGKTSVKFFLGQLLGVRYDVLITPESFNTPMGVVRTVREHMTPGTEIFVCEMGARHVGDIKELCDLVHPDHGVITSIGPQHLDTFFNMENIVSTKFELADALPAEGKLFLNGDNDYIRGNSSKYGNVIMYGTGAGEEEKGDGYARPGDVSANGYRASNITLSPRGTTFDVHTPEGDSDTFSMPLIGAHNIVNVMAAIAVAHSFGIDLRELKIPVRRLQGAPHRLELKRHGNMNIIDDAYNSNPVGSKAALETLKLFDGMKVIITPGMVELGEKEEEYNREFGRYAAEVCDHILLVGRKRGEIIADGALKAAPAKKDSIRIFDRFEEAYEYAAGIPCEGEKYILLENDLPDNY